MNVIYRIYRKSNNKYKHKQKIHANITTHTQTKKYMIFSVQTEQDEIMNNSVIL